MGNANGYQRIKQEAIKSRDQRLQAQMTVIRSQCAKHHINLEVAAQIANHSAHQIVKMLNNYQISSEVLLLSLCLRSASVNKQLNFVTITNFVEALESAKKCDEIRKKSGKNNWRFQDGPYAQQKFLPPFFGIPISVKDVFHVNGIPTMFGMLSRTKNFEPESPLITCLKNSGMIPFIKTNLPQVGMTAETTNNIWGRTLNPWNKQRGPGGSSGGEGSIISSKCSVIGLGSDIGGSIRIPSDHCGIFGIKPYSSRISSKFHAKLSKSYESFDMVIPNSIGPLARSARDLAIFMSIACNIDFYQGNSDPYKKIVPFNHEAYLQVQRGTKKYRIGYFTQIKQIEPSSASKRAVAQIVTLLRNEGHELIEVQIPQSNEIFRHFFREYLQWGRGYKNLLKGQQPIEQYRSLFNTSTLNSWMRWRMQTFMRKYNPRIFYYIFDKKPFSKVIDYQKHIGQLQQLKTKWIQYWKSKQIDFLVCPGFGAQAFPHGKSENAGLSFIYTSIWNTLCMVAGSVPVTTVRENEQHYESATNDLVTQQLRQIANNSVGLPVGIQIVGLPYDQQRVLGMMSYLQSKIEFYKNHALPKY